MPDDRRSIEEGLILHRSERSDARVPVIIGLISLAWFTLIVWEQTPYGRYLDHGQWLEVGIVANICRSLPAGSVIFPALLYLAGWVLMTVAMMLPMSLPLLRSFAQTTATRPDRGLLLTLLITGYLATWAAFGVIAHAADMGLHEIVAENVYLSFNGWIISVVILTIAGLFQFSRFKYECLDKCRTPSSFVNEYWRHDAGLWQSFLLGVHHGLFCLGCSWAIMLLMFLVGTGSVGWMLALGAVMAIERNVLWGKWLGVPIGIILLSFSSGIVALNI
jgi:predicted metal-binding membrane protein